VVFAYFGNNTIPIMTQLTTIFTASVTDSAHRIDEAVLCSENADHFSEEVHSRLMTFIMNDVFVML
jgi:hypothetical protein